MLRLLLAASSVAALTGCATSTRLMPISPTEVPGPPAAALEPCTPTPQHRQPDGSASSSDDDATIRDGRFDLKRCDDKRRLVIEAWPRSTPTARPPAR